MPGEVAPSLDPPSGLPTLVEWFDRFSLALVRLAPYPLEEVRDAVATFARGVEAHLGAPVRAPPGAGIRPGRTQGPAEALAREHAWFRTSLEQLRWFLGIVERDDHGGHRQALGQYGRLLAEALRLHLEDEAATSATTGSRKA